MIELISSLFSEGDPIKLEYGQKAQIVSGTIFKIATDSIAIKKFEGGIAGIKGTEIISFDTIETPDQTITKPVQETYAQVSHNNEPKISDNSESQTPSVQSPVEPFNVSEEQKEDIVATPTPPLLKDKRITPQTATTSSKEVIKERMKDAKHKSKGTLNGGKTNNLGDLASLLGMEDSISQMREISKIKPRECPLIKFKRHSFFFFIDKIHKLCCNGRPCFRYNWCAVHLSPLLVLDLISTWSNRIYSPPDSRGRSARVCRSSLVSVCKSVISS